MNKCFTQPYQRCTVGTSAPIYTLLWTGQENRSVIKAIISRSWLETLMITVLFPDKNFLNSNLLSFFSLSLSLLLPLREHKVRFTYLSICYYADYGNVFTRMPLDTSVKQLWRLCTMPKICDSKQFVSSQWQLLRTDKVDPEYVVLCFWRHSVGLFV